MSDMEEIVTINAQGRIVIPAHIRKQLGLSGGETLNLHVDDEGLHLRPRGYYLRRVRQQLAPPEGGSATDNLIRERRANAKSE